MKIISSYFGELDVSESNIIRFNSAIPGFENMHRYFLIADSDDESNGGGLFWWLHSVDNGDIAFALLDVFKVMDNYQPEIEEEFLKEIQFTDGDEIVVYNIANIPETTDDMTVNLLAPIVINMTKMVGMQVILNNDIYSLKFRIFDMIKEKASNLQKEEV